VEAATRISSYQDVVDDICELNWSGLSRDDLIAVTWGYYYFSVQFRENLEVACALHPGDQKLERLRREECDTDNLSPWPGVAEPQERMNHDEFMRRTLSLARIDEEAKRRLEALGECYLEEMRRMPPVSKALSIASYEDGGLERVFRAMLLAPDWAAAPLAAFRHFLVEHIRFDSDPTEGHGALSRHLVPDDRIVPSWGGFRNLLIGAVPKLGG
jgi:hypothetical protein